MQNPANQKKAYKILSVVFGVAGLVWIILGLSSPRYIFYPLIGLINWGIAWYCNQAGKNQ
jgi:hypothetical protein